MEEKVTIILQKRKEFLDEDLANQPAGAFSNNNKIPRKVRNMMRNKSKLSKAILRSKSAQRFLKLKEKLEEIEIQLKSSYQERRTSQEKKAIEQIKKNPKVFFSYAKRFAKTNSDIGPFFSKDGNPVQDPEVIAEMLKEHYDSVAVYNRVTMVLSQTSSS